VHVFDRDWTGLKPELVRALGGIQCSSLDGAPEHSKPDIVMECTSAASVIGKLLGRTAPGGIICLLGVSGPGDKIDVDMGTVNRTVVLDNDVVFGSVNANRTHYERPRRRSPMQTGIGCAASSPGGCHSNAGARRWSIGPATSRRSSIFLTFRHNSEASKRTDPPPSKEQPIILFRILRSRRGCPRRVAL
jgi:hypothetical protein